MKAPEKRERRRKALKDAYDSLLRDTLDIARYRVQTYDESLTTEYCIKWRTRPSCIPCHDEVIRMLLVFLRHLRIKVRTGKMDLSMNPGYFFNKVVEMRRLQKEYFRTRSPLLLNESKKIEREIDAEIKRVNDIMINGGVLF